MENKVPFEEILQDIFATEEFHRLEELKNASLWSKMTDGEKTLFSNCLLAYGENLLKEGDSNAFHNFDLALTISPENPKVYYRQAMAFITQECNMRWLDATCKALKKATDLDPTYFDAWCAWGCTLTRIGMLDDAVIYFEEANEKFQKAKENSENITPIKLAEMNWQWGLSCYCHGKLSGEACDFYEALDKYRFSLDTGLLIPDFFSDYGDAIVEIAILLGKKELFSEAIELYRKSIQLSPDHFEGWLSLACSFRKIYEYSKEEGYLNFANESFAKAAELNSDLPELWLHWGELLMDAGKSKDDVDLLKLSCEKIEIAYRLDQEHAPTLKSWAESLMLLGSFTERIDYLKEAESKIIKSLNLYSDDPDCWYIYGNILTEIGRYFSDEGFFLKAIEKFRYGLSLSQNRPILWYGLALATFAIGEFCHDVSMIEESLRHFAKAIEFGGQATHQFWNDWGVALMHFGEMTQDSSHLELAIEKFEKVVEISDQGHFTTEVEWVYNYASALDLLGNINEDSTLVEKAVQIFSQILIQDITHTDARYQLALSLTHLGELTDDIESFTKANELFLQLVTEDPEDETSWNEWGLSILNLAELTFDSTHPEKTQEFYKQAEEKFLHANALGCSSAFYNLACLYSLLKNFNAAMHYIAKAESAGTLPMIEDILHDDWLEALRDTQDFKNFISLLSTKENDIAG